MNISVNSKYPPSILCRWRTMHSDIRIPEPIRLIIPKALFMPIGLIKQLSATIILRPVQGLPSCPRESRIPKFKAISSIGGGVATVAPVTCIVLDCIVLYWTQVRIPDPKVMAMRSMEIRFITHWKLADIYWNQGHSIPIISGGTAIVSDWSLRLRWQLCSIPLILSCPNR